MGNTIGAYTRYIINILTLVAVEASTDVDLLTAYHHDPLTWVRDKCDWGLLLFATHQHFVNRA